MLLCEEYLKRHCLSVPFVKCQKKIYFYTRYFNSDVIEWNLFSIEWEPSLAYRGSYTVKIYKPIVSTRYNYSNEKILEKVQLEEIIEPFKLKQDEYEDYMYKIVSSHTNKNIIVCGNLEIKLTLWEMFVYSNNCYFNLNYKHLSNYLFQSLDFTSSKEIRYAGYKNFINHLDEKNELHCLWEAELEDHLSNYCYWLEDLLNEKS